MNNLKGLFVFSITNMLERFGFYALMSILILSFMEVRGYSGEEAGYLYTIFYTAMYISMLIMGLIGDFVNRRKVIIAGMVSMAIGYFLYSMMSKGNEISLIIPGIFLILGVGAFKTNLQVQVGDLYRNNLKNGVLGYLIFYSMINVGAIFAPLVAVYFKKEYGFDSVYLLSGGTMLLALALYYLTPVTIETEQESQIEQRKVKTNDIINSSEVAPIVERSENGGYGIDKLIGLIFLIFLVPIFWVAFHQNALVYVFYVRDFIDLNGYSPEILQAINPIALVLFSIIGVVLMYFFLKIKRSHSIFLFLMTGMFIVAIGYLIPVYGLTNLSGKLSYFNYAVIPMVIITLGELFISPFLILGFYHFSPAKVKGLFMGLFMAISAVGNLLLFIYAKVYETHGAAQTFLEIVIHVLICTALVFLVWLLIKKLSSLNKNLDIDI